MSLYRAGNALDAPSDMAELASCAEVEESLKTLKSKDWEVKFEDTTPAPTVTREWDIYWTDGAWDGDVEDAYVWTTDEYNEGYLATVLVNTLGTAEGIDIASNGTYVYFGADSNGEDDFDYNSCIVKAAVDGSLVELVFCYGDASNSSSSDIQGIALYEGIGKIFWVDSILNKLYSTDIENNDGSYEEVSSFTKPYDVAVDERANKLFVSDKYGIFKIDTDGSDKTQTIDQSSIQSFKGMDVDAVNGNLYFMGDSTLWGASTLAPDAYWEVYGNLDSPLGVAVDGSQDLIFWTDATGVYRGSTSGFLSKVTVADLDNSRFICVEGYASPTPAPTALPTSKPTHVPSNVPTSKPSEHPTAVPYPSPTKAPIPYPTSVPTSYPSFLPSAEPSGLPTSKPTHYPTHTPTSAPTYTPTSKPTHMPTPIPTEHPSHAPTSKPSAAPTTECWKWQEDCNWCDGSAGSECAVPSPMPTRPYMTPKPTSEGHGSQPGPPPPPQPEASDLADDDATDDDGESSESDDTSSESDDTSSTTYTTTLKKYCSNDYDGAEGFISEYSTITEAAECETLCNDNDACNFIEMDCATKCILLEFCASEASSGCDSYIAEKN